MNTRAITITFALIAIVGGTVVLRGYRTHESEVMTAYPDSTMDRINATVPALLDRLDVLVTTPERTPEQKAEMTAIVERIASDLPQSVTSTTDMGTAVWINTAKARTDLAELTAYRDSVRAER